MTILLKLKKKKYFFSIYTLFALGSQKDGNGEKNDGKLDCLDYKKK